MTDVARIEVEGKSYEFPVVVGTEDEKAIDISKLRADTGYITLDDGYGNTGSCKSDITFIDGDEGILRYRGYAIEELAEKSSFVEVAWLVIFGELPTAAQRARFSEILTENSALPEPMRKHFEAFPPHAHPMAILSAMINALSPYEPLQEEVNNDDDVAKVAGRLMSKVRTIAAAAYKSSVGQPIMPPRYDLKYTDNFLHMMFSQPYKEYEPAPEVARALNLFLLLHADHEQNCSTSTVRMVASSQASMYASCAAGVCALWGPLHGGANVAVVEMLQDMKDRGISADEFLTKVKNKEDGVKLMGFGHRVYKNFDPRSRILKKAADDVLKNLNVDDPLLEMAQGMEEVALKDEYFIERKLYPNVDFYSGVILRAIGIPVDMYTVMFAMGRMPGWIANWKEINDDKSRIYRPRQVYTGSALREFVPRSERG